MYMAYGRSVIGQGTMIGAHVIIGYPSRAELATSTPRTNSSSGSSGLDDSPLDPAKFKDIEGAKIGENCILRDFGVIYSKTIIGNEVQTGHHYLVRESSTIGSGTLIGSNVIIEDQCKIGNNVSIQSGVYIPTYSIIEDNVFLGPNSVLTNDKYIGYEDPRKGDLKGVMIEKNASIGANSTILPGVRIGHNAVVGSGAVVTRDVAPGTVVAGVPAKPFANK